MTAVLKIPEPPPFRGKWLNVDDVRAMFQNADVSREWVYRNVPHKVVLSRKRVGWFEYDVRDWLEECRAD